MSPTTAQLSAQLAPLGPYFRVRWGSDGVPPQAAQRIRSVAPTLPRPVPERVTASVAHLDLASRVLSPLLGMAVLGEVAITPDPLLLAPIDPIPVLPPTPLPETVDAAWAERVLTGPVAQLRTAFSVVLDNARIREGNVASAVHGAATVLGALVPGQAQRTEQVAGLFLNHPLLRGAWTSPPFTRTTCCLIYQATGRDRLCGDCVLRAGRR